MSYNQPPPPPGGTPPPPPGGGYGAPPPGGGGFGGPPPTGQWDLGTTINYAWTKFQANMGQFILAAVGLFFAVVVVAVVAFVIVGALISFDTPGIVVFVLYALIYGLILLVMTVVNAGLIKGALGITEGRPFQAAEAFKFDDIGRVLTTAVLVGLGTMVGFILCYLPGIVFAFVSSYALHFTIDKRLAPVEAIKASIDLVKNNLGNTLIWYIVGGLIGGAGAIACGIGIIFTLPIMIIGTAYTYKTLTGQPVAP